MATNVTVTGTTATVTDDGTTVVVSTAAGSVWGTITGTLANQADLVSEFAGKVSTAGGSTVTSSAAAVKALVLKGATSQSANLFEIQDSAGTILVRTTAGGSCRINMADDPVILGIAGATYAVRYGADSNSAIMEAVDASTLVSSYQPLKIGSSETFFNTGGAEAMRINGGRELLIGYTTDNGTYKLQVNSQIFATSATVATSDGRFKKDVADLADGWDVIRALRPVSFKWKDQAPVLDKSGEVVREAHNFPDGTHVGFIAQEVKAALDDRLWIDNLIKRNKRPEVIAEDGTVAPEEPFLGIAEGNLIPILTSALQTAMDRIEALETRLDAAGL